MNRTFVRRKTLSPALAGLCGMLFAAGAVLAAEYPRLTARHAGSGTYEIRGGGGTWELANARVVLDEEGRASIAVSGRKIQLAMSGRIVGWNGREHVDIVLDTFDGKATTAKGWIALDRRGGFERIEFDGQTPVRLGVSFRSQGANLEPPPPPPVPPQPPTPPQGMTEEPNVNRRGADYRHFTAEGLRLCQESCKGDTRCRAYSYNLNSRTCYLKAQVPGSSSDREVISGVKEGWSGGPGGDGAGGEKRLTEERGLDRRGNDYSDFRVRDLRDCQESCLRDERCRAYTYDTIERICWLKDRVNSQQRNRDRVTGYKE